MSVLTRDEHARHAARELAGPRQVVQRLPGGGAWWATRVAVMSQRPVAVHVRTADQGDGNRTYAISVPREIAAQLDGKSYMPELLAGGTLVYRPMVPAYERVEER